MYISKPNYLHIREKIKKRIKTGQNSLRQNECHFQIQNATEPWSVALIQKFKVFQ